MDAEVAGPAGAFNAKLILDTGATTTCLSSKVLRSVGFASSMAIGQAQLITGSAVSTARLFMVNRLSALGQHAIGWRGLARDLPPSAAADGLLGLSAQDRLNVKCRHPCGVVPRGWSPDEPFACCCRACPR
ncbi:MAG: aspartyl protease family protein [Isosphaeraceae bacterium]